MIKSNHNYSKPLTREEVRAIKLYRPHDAGSQWKGIKHSKLLDIMLDEFRDRGWGILAEDYATVKGNDAAMAASFILDIPELNKMLKGRCRFSIGVSHANDRHQRIRFWCGAVASEGTGIVVSSFALKRKHIKGLDIKEDIGEALDNFRLKAPKIKRAIEELKNLHLTQFQYEHILMQAGRTRVKNGRPTQKIIPWQRLGYVDAEVLPNFDFEKSGLGTKEIPKVTAWKVYLAFAKTVKKNPVMIQMRQMLDFRAMLTRELTKGLSNEQERSHLSKGTAKASEA